MGGSVRPLPPTQASRQVAASTQEQALCALLFLYKHVLDRPLRLAGRIARGRAPTRVPHVLARGEVSRVLSQLTGVYRLVGTLLYGSGLRLLECLTLRVKDLDLGRGEFRVRRGKGGKDRVTVIPATMAGPLRDHLDRVRRLHLRDLSVEPDASRFRMFWRGSTLERQRSGTGNGFFRPIAPTLTSKQASAGDTTCIPPPCSGRWRRQ